MLFPLASCCILQSGFYLHHSFLTVSMFELYVSHPEVLVKQLLLFIIDIQPLGRSGQRSELSQSTGIALVCCILGKFLGVVCHCFPPRLDVPTFTTRCLHVVTTREILAADGGTVGENVVR